ncbi:hypothetical protein FOA52_012859 [Chlamydomonas sp. UWO 241]|nr:hypothetical protein FOA52_012859 [Chlamydomonas sp. UWO 241]
MDPPAPSSERSSGSAGGIPQVECMHSSSSGAEPSGGAFDSTESMVASIAGMSLNHGLQLNASSHTNSDDEHTEPSQVVEAVNEQNRMLFFAKVLRPATEDKIKELFGKFGKVYDVNLFRAFQGAPTSKGCELATMGMHDEAAAAIDALNGSKLGFAPSGVICELTATAAPHYCLLSQGCGLGCGLVTMGTHDEAAAAIDALNGTHTWAGMDSPMVVKWMDTALQQRRRETHLSAVRRGLAPRPEAWLSRGMPQALTLGLGQPGQIGLMGFGQMLGDASPSEPVPAGCDPDAIKLFVGNLPTSCTEDHLLPFFEAIGPVVELVVVKDKVTRRSKGSAFVWYATRAAADLAILQLNLRHVLPDPSGVQDRPLVVRIAKAQARTAHAYPQAVSMLDVGPLPHHHHQLGLGGVDHHGFVLSHHHAPGVGMQQYQQPQHQGGSGMMLGQPGAGMMMHGAPGMVGMGMGLQQEHGAGGMMGMGQQQQQQPGGFGSAAGAQAVIHMAGGHMLTAVGAGNGGAQMGAGIDHEYLSGGNLSGHVTGGHLSGGHLSGGHATGGHLSGTHASGAHLASGHLSAGHLSGAHLSGGNAVVGLDGGGVGGVGDHGAISITIDVEQISLVNKHMFIVQTISGAQLNITPVAQGFFQLVVSGSKVQVEHAKDLLSTVFMAGYSGGMLPDGTMLE